MFVILFRFLYVPQITTLIELDIKVKGKNNCEPLNRNTKRFLLDL